MKLCLFTFLAFTTNIVFSWNNFKITKNKLIKSVATGLVGFSIMSPLNIPQVNAMPPVEQIQISNYIKEDKNNIYLYGPINYETTRKIEELLINQDLAARIFKEKFYTEPPSINLHIQSEGGSFLHSLYLIDVIQNLNTPVNTYVDGFAASAATLISVSGDKRYITKNSLMLIHQLYSQNEGKYNQLDDGIHNIETFMNLIRNLYLSKTKFEINNLNELLSHDLWLTSDKCLQYGLVDEII